MTPPRILGITGSRHGITPPQRALLRAIIADADEINHGKCQGVDAEAHALALELGKQSVAHPPTNSTWEAPCEGALLLPRQDYLARDRAIVDRTRALVAVPRTSTERVRSGTWYTVRYARAQGRPVCLLWPNGQYTLERWA